MIDLFVKTVLWACGGVLAIAGVGLIINALLFQGIGATIATVISCCIVYAVIRWGES